MTTTFARTGGSTSDDQVVALDLARWDAAGIPTYLESSNPANDHRYERQGFRKVGEFETVLDHAVVSTMWRPVGG